MSNLIPQDFMFQLTKKEKEEVVANCDYLSNLKFSPNLPYAFTEHGAIMVASVLNTDRAVEMSVYVVKIFVKLRQILSVHKELAYKLNELERKTKKHDSEIKTIFEAIRQLMVPVTTTLISPDKPFSNKMAIIDIIKSCEDYIYRDKCFNVPSTDILARGQYSEVKETTNRPPFNEWWNNSKDIINGWNEIRNIKK